MAAEAKFEYPQKEDKQCADFKFLHALETADWLLNRPNPKSIRKQVGEYKIPPQMMYIQAWLPDAEDEKKADTSQQAAKIAIPDIAPVEMLVRQQVPNEYSKMFPVYRLYAGYSHNDKTSVIVARSVVDSKHRKNLDPRYKDKTGKAIFHTERLILDMLDPAKTDNPLFGNKRYGGGIALIISTNSPCEKCGDEGRITKICKLIGAKQCIYLYGVPWRGSGPDAKATRPVFFTSPKIGNIPVFQCFGSVTSVPLYEDRNKKKDTANIQYHDMYSAHYLNAISNQKSDENSKSLTVATDDVLPGYGFDRYNEYGSHYQSHQDGYRAAGKLLHSHAHNHAYRNEFDHNWDGDEHFVIPYLFGFISGVVPMAALCFLCMVLAFILGRVWNKITAINRNHTKDMDESQINDHV